MDYSKILEIRYINKNDIHNTLKIYFRKRREIQSRVFIGDNLRRTSTSSYLFICAWKTYLLKHSKKI